MTTKVTERIASIDWTKSHCGIMLSTLDQARDLMPELNPIIDSIIPHLQYNQHEYLIDCKVHMLMPGEYPCIPNWHCDFVPRDQDNRPQRSEIRDTDMMYIWVSGPPYTEFKTHHGKIETDEITWTRFNQRDVHRGTISEIHTWRSFVRLIPRWFRHTSTFNTGQVRRHSQVYIENPDKFTW